MKEHAYSAILEEILLKMDSVFARMDFFRILIKSVLTAVWKDAYSVQAFKVAPNVTLIKVISSQVESAN
jgi:hypothetical protein